MKHGSFSLILSKKEYSKIGFKDQSDNSLLKITRYNKRHNGELSVINVLSNDNNYTMKIYRNSIGKIGTNEISILTEEFKEYFKTNDVRLFISPVQYLTMYFMENAGGIDLFDTLSNLIYIEDNIWESETYVKLLMFVEQMCSALNYFQECRIGHFDIKPENIVYNDSNTNLPFSKKFKIIDFGFAEYYPFEKALKTYLGTEFYMPADLRKPYPEWAIKNKPNDWFYDNSTKSVYHYINYNNHDYNLMYKNDVYSMGITINHLLFYIKFYFKEKQLDIFNTSKIDKLILKMVNPDMEKRYFGYQCLEFIEDITEKKVCCFF